MEKKKQSKMKWGVLVGIVLLLIISLVAGACAKAPAPATPTPAKPVATPTPTPAKVYHLRLNSTAGAVSGEPVYEIVSLFIKTVKERSGGQIDIGYFPSNQLFATGESLEALGKGIIDFQYANLAHFESKVPEGSVISLPLLAKDYAGYAAKIYPDMYPVIDEAFQKQGVKVVGIFPGGPSHIMTLAKPVQKMEDLKGLLLRTSGTASTDLIKALGGSPTYIAWAEVPLAVERKTVDGVLVDLASAVSVQTLVERLKYVTYPGLSRGGSTIFMNLRLYNEMPPELRKLVTDTAKEIALGKGKDIRETAIKEGENTVTKAGWQIYQLPAGELARWEQVARGLWGDFLKAVPGPLGEKLFELAKK